MNRSELYEDLSDIIASYQYHGAVDVDDNTVDASDLYRMLAKIHANWTSIVAD